MTLLFDTNAVLIYLRNQPVKGIIESTYKPFGSLNTAVISVVTVGELKAFALKNQWGRPKIQTMDAFVLRFVVSDINTEDVINRYAEIDAFSQGRLVGKKSGLSARNMGKNDIWIAATASVLDAILLTTDNDFDHLHNEYFTVAQVDLKTI